MVICPKCGTDNPLGRVFCGKCGGKLDFTNVTSQEMAEKNKPGPASKIVKIVVTVLVLALLGLAGLAFWPKPGELGKAGQKDGERRVANTIRAMSMVRKGQMLTVPLLEEDVNAYFAEGKAKGLGFETASLATAQGYFVVRAVRVIGPWKVGKFEVGPRISYELTCVPFGGKAVVRKAAVGHLPAIGPLASVVTKAIGGPIAADPAWAPFKTLSDLKVEPGRVTLTIKP